MREKLAELCHQQWSGWMEYLFSKCFVEFDKQSGELIIPAWEVERWSRQMQTEYKDLSEQEKESDRKEADKFISAISDHKS